MSKKQLFETGQIVTARDAKGEYSARIEDFNGDWYTLRFEDGSVLHTSEKYLLQWNEPKGK